MWSDLLQQLLDRQALTQEQATQLMQGWLAAEIPDALAGAILTALQFKGLTVEELTGMAKVLLAQSAGAPLNLAEPSLIPAAPGAIARVPLISPQRLPLLSQQPRQSG